MQYMTDEDIEMLENLVFNDEIDYVKCSNENCEYETAIEPDGDYQCPECNIGRVTSHLLQYGLI